MSVREALRPLLRVAFSTILASGVTATAEAKDWYVDAKAPPGGDGSSGKPFTTIGDGVLAASDGDRILIAAGSYSGPLVVDKSVTLLGDRAAATLVTGGGPVITIPAGEDVWLQDLEISGGVSDAGGGVSNAGTTLAVRCRVHDCHASSDRRDARGGGIDNSGTLLMWSCAVEDCTAATYFGLFGLWSGESPLGAGIANSGTLKLFNSTVAHNAASTDVFHIYYPALGGGIYNTGTLRLIDSTISGNTVFATTTAGAGILSFGELTIEHSTIALNLATARFPYSGGMGSSWGGGVSGDAAVFHSVFSANEVHDDNFDANSGGPDFAGTCESRGYLLMSDSADATITGDMTGVQLDVDAKLLALAANGGPVATHALDPASPCLDAGNPDPLASPPYDARGFPRALWDPAVGACDLGAYEEGAGPSFMLTATPDLPLPSGAPVALTVGGGDFGHPTVLALVDFNGTPMFLPIVITAFDQTGVLFLEGTVPAGLAGTTADLQDYALDAANRLVATNRVTLTFQ